MNGVIRKSKMFKFSMLLKEVIRTRCTLICSYKLNTTTNNFT
jgi:hypothetical protein